MKEGVNHTLRFHACAAINCEPLRHESVREEGRPADIKIPLLTERASADQAEMLIQQPGKVVGISTFLLTGRT